MNYHVISADSHLEIPADRWVHRVPREHRDRAPRRIRLPDGTDAHLVEGRPLRFGGLNLCGKPYEEYSPAGGCYDDTPGTGTPEQRLREQDTDGVDAEVLYPGVGGPEFWRGIKDEKAYQGVVRGYNNFLGEEYCAYAPDRLLGVGVIPETGVHDAITEMEHCARIGLKAGLLNAFPSGHMYPTPEDDAFWSAAVEMGMPITVHVQLSSGVDRTGSGGTPSGPWFKYTSNPGPNVSPSGQDPVALFANYMTVRGGKNAIQMVVSGVFDRFPKLHIYFAENQIGWIPNFLEQADNFYHRHRHWLDRQYGIKQLPRLPSEYILGHCWWGFMDNPLGVRLCHLTGVNHVMWGSDFPHSESDWPASRLVIERSFVEVSEEKKYRMVAGNAVDFFHLDVKRGHDRLSL